MSARPTQITAVRRLHFCAGHRVVGHEGKCANLHGHNYVAFVHVRSRGGDLDDVGRVIDFGVIKQKVGGWIDEHWDHGFIFWSQDPDLAALYDDQLAAMKYFRAEWNPTAENMASHLLAVATELLAGDLVVEKVEMWETENCYADAQPQD
ncbi:MAG: 6-carboxytetrahydropterin synthase [Candidatus Latescibacteria bacterium]|jgi:6-pyruvoyltetrahydropterin/6-carboxytetrahydropterin synthase|nr:6-carboxy-5,6,7,8-tetrahydropterin synthase [Gemmatimonadaceae bacterium]MDP6015001.1 6-carboxytetrahydropterin synthase [Candidatus Latescibacterota bacterium]MDP7449044.1 6-carboxytetrahydropterin synthase [Candidatus Latescibacterota bacterium]HJP29072.1 6-carboxytetrahydropterin synthase [Candidatus Latescibacterota bacterium]